MLLHGRQTACALGFIMMHSKLSALPRSHASSLLLANVGTASAAQGIVQRCSRTCAALLNHIMSV